MWKIVFLVFIVSNSYAQSITPNEARWCIINYDQNKEYKNLIKDMDSLLNSKGVKIKLQNEEIKDYKKDSTNYTKTINNNNIIISNKNKELKYTKLENFLLKVGIVILVIIEIVKKQYDRY